MTELKRRILEDIVENVSQAKYNDVAPLLLRAKVVIEPPDDGRPRNEHDLEAEKRGGKRAIWQSGIISHLADSLYRDYLKVENDWLCAAELCQLLVTCCTASEDMAHAPKFRQAVLRKTSKGLWSLLHHIYQRLDWGIDSGAIARASAAFQKVSISAHQFFLEFADLVIDAWTSPDFLGMLENQRSQSLDWVLWDLCVKLTNLNQQSVFDLPKEQRQKILDATMQKLARTEDQRSASSCFQFILAWLDAFPLLLSSLMAKHSEAIKTQMQKWRGHGFDGPLNTLNGYIATGVVAESHDQRLHEAAARIQASYRAYRLRRRFAKMKAGIIKLQQLFRLRRRKTSITAAASAKEHEIQYQNNVKRYQNDRKYLEKRLKTVGCIHASLVDHYLETEADRAATKIQAAWRGYWSRKGFRQRMAEAKRDKAARIIQKHMRQWYEKRRSIKNRMREWPGLTESRREELQLIIDRYQERYKTRHLAPRQTQKESHEKAQTMLIDHYKRRYSSLNAYQKREATLARLQMNIQILETAPKLSEVTTRDVYAFTARSTAIANRAAHAHQEELRFQRLPKWKQLLERADGENKSESFH